MTYFIQVLTAFLGSLGFSVLFNIRRTKLLIAGFGGALSWGVFLLINNLVSSSEPFGYFVAAMAVTVYAEIFARIKKTPTTTFLVSGMIPMIPGGALYYTMNYALKSDWKMFSQEGMYTVSLAIALAVGIIVVSSVVRMATAVTNYIIKMKNKK